MFSRNLLVKLRLLDQRWWAARVTELGCGSKPVKVETDSSVDVCVCLVGQN